MAIDTTGFALPKPSVIEGITRLSKRALEKLRRQKWEAKERTCYLCERPISDFSNYCLDHVLPASCHIKNDSSDNLKPTHVWPCNFIKGSRRDIEEVKNILRGMFFS